MPSPPTTSLGQIELRHVIGQGGFGKVMLGYDKKLKKEVAVKVIDKALVRENNLQSYVEREIEMMRKIKHPHVVKLLSVVDTSKGYHLVMELATGGELFDKIVESKRFDEITARRYFQQLISAVYYCHCHKIVHRDLKAENLLLGPQGDLKVCDFGLSRYTTKGSFNDNPILFTSLAGSTDYQAPEVIREGGYQGSSCDMWSCGVILFFMMCGYLPFADKNDDLTRKRILNCEYNKNARYLPEAVKDLLQHLLDVNPNTRYSAHRTIEHPWFQKDLDWTMFPNFATASPVAVTPAGGSPTSAGSQVGFDKTTSTANLDSPEVMSPCHAGNTSTSNPRTLLHQAFVSCNVDRTGFLTHDEVRDVLIKLNETAVASAAAKGKDIPAQRVTEDDVREFMSNFDLDNKGRITEEQFIVGWQKNAGKTAKYSLSRLCNVFHFEVERELLAELRKAFDVLDGDHSGLVVPQNIAKLNLGLSEKEITELFQIMDPVHPGKAALSFENFVLFCTKYDLLQKHPLAMRLRRLESLFDATDFQVFRNAISTGFTVAGLRDIILTKISVEARNTLQTSIAIGETEGYLYGTLMEGDRRILEVGIQLLPAAQGYTKVLAYRIGGKTEHFHDWFRNFRKLLREEILICAEDTAVRGDSELM
ncbi:protein kinase, putative [Bodo saltans]|uniref:non-specific serine/threonine protein kinase n=1 Tax=Bodo saltans TaxID=75058 RepID=A0A0S4JIY0_BODSA|nr:protein kinase, putative [Bodo saltans]|eukprot:CUG90126.1 protein kinase, putative [Bodo saltans]